MAVRNRASGARVLLWTGKLLASLVVLVLLAGLAFQWSATRLDEHRYPMPGVLVKVQGHSMHLDCTGQGSPTVIFDAGLGDTSATWALVQPSIAQFTRACSYDRPGFGWSDETSEPRDSLHVAANLQELLLQAHIDGPYILVGHSFGGINQLVFASLHPDQVMGIVLVDSSYPDQMSRLPGVTPEQYAADMKWKVLAAPFGLQRLTGWCRDDYTFPNISAAWQKVAPVDIALDCRTSTVRATRDEMLAFRQSGNEAATITSLHALPLIVLSHDPKIGLGAPPEIAAQTENLWNTMQEQFRSLSPNSKRVIARGSMHYIESYRPELVIHAIQEVYAASKNGTSISAATTEQ